MPYNNHRTPSRYQRNNHRRRHRGHGDNSGEGIGGLVAYIYCAFVGAYECSETMVNTLFCSYLFQIILLSCMVSFGNMWASSKMGKNTAIVAERGLSNSPTSFTFGPYGYCVIGNSSTIPTRCFNPNKAEEYTKKHTAIQKLCFDKAVQSESYLKTCSEWCSRNCYSAKFLKEIKKTDKKKRAFCDWDNTLEKYINEDGYNCCNAFTPRKYMPTSGCDISHYRAIECKVAGVLSPPLKEETASDKLLTDSIVDGQPEICQPSLHDYTIEIDDICSVELEKLMPLMTAFNKEEQQKLIEKACRESIIKANSTTNKLFTLDQVDPQYIQPIMKMQNMGNAAIIYVILGTIFSFISMYFNPFGHENIPMRKKIIGVIYGNEAKETFETGICYCTFLQSGCCISNYKRINFSLAKVPKNMLRSWMCLCILLLLLQALSILNIVELLQVWNNEGVLHMVGFASKYISVYDYQSGYGKTFSGKLQIHEGNPGGYYTLLLIPFFVIGGLQFLHLLYACTISINLVCNKSKQVSTNETYENETGLGEDIEISSPKPLQRPLLGKNNPAFAQLMARTQDPQMQQQMQMAQNMMQDPRMQQQMQMAQNMMQDPRMQQQMMQMAQLMAQNTMQDPQMQQQMQMAQNTMQGVSKSTDDNNSFDKERPLSYGPDQPSLNGKNNEK